MCTYVVMLLIALAAAAVAVVEAAPQTSTADAATTAAATAAAAGADEVVYDQRQNGTENVRISLSDLKVVVAPADGLFGIISMAGAGLLSDQFGAASENKPSTVDCNGFKCNNRIRQAAKKSV
ncbi:uncharacterized protein LOC126845157 [Adelges cooleyi]|uniref:uncharacterized protein LOC126845157 n=1 Tax=Adelges cooleyi TaxID=133065 RepID=UPI00217FACD7|nr:uncharacterized protein LOC126845157 [Adelges cooleyi]